MSDLLLRKKVVHGHDFFDLVEFLGIEGLIVVFIVEVSLDVGIGPKRFTLWVVASRDQSLLPESLGSLLGATG